MVLPLSPQVKFSYNIVKGSPEARRRMASRLNEAFFQAAHPKIENDKISMTDFEQAFQSVMPQKVNVVVKKLRSWFGGYDGLSQYIYNKDDEIVGQTIEISARKGMIKSKALPVAFHESRHAIDVLVNPKYTARVIAMENAGLYTKSYERLYNKHLYNYEDCYTLQGKIDRLKSIEKKIWKFLNGKPVEDRINCIQDMRYSLETESNAFGDTAKYARKLRQRNYDIREDDLVDDRRDYMFAEKIALLKKIGFEIIQAERERMAR